MRCTSGLVRFDKQINLPRLPKTLVDSPLGPSHHPLCTNHALRPIAIREGVEVCHDLRSTLPTQSFKISAIHVLQRESRRRGPWVCTSPQPSAPGRPEYQCSWSKSYLQSTYSMRRLRAVSPSTVLRPCAAKLLLSNLSIKPPVVNGPSFLGFLPSCRSHVAIPSLRYIMSPVHRPQSSAPHHPAAVFL